MELNEYIKAMNSVVADLESAQGDLLVNMGLEATKLIKERIQETGKMADNSPFGSPNNPTGYSRKPMLTNQSAFFVKSGATTVAGSKEKRKELKWVTIKRGNKNIKLFELERGYEQFRDLQGRQVDHVDFSFTGIMWGNINIKSKTENSVTIGALSKDNQDKLEGNTKRFGQILDVSREELRKLNENNKTRVLKIFDKHGVR